MSEKPAAETSRPVQGNESARKSSGLHPWLVAILILFLGAVVMVLLGALLMRRVITNSMAPEYRQKVERFFREPVVIPDSWREVRPYAPEVVAAEKRVMDVYDADSAAMAPFSRDLEPLRSAQRGGTISEEGWTSLTGVVASGKRFLEVSSASLALQGYEMGAAPPGLSSYPYHSGPFLLPQVACAAAHLHAREGRWDSAIDYALLPLRRARRRSGCEEIVHRWAYHSVIDGTRSIARLASDCPDPGRLTSVLNELNRRRPEVLYDLFSNAELITATGKLQNFARAGYPVDLTSGHATVWYFDQMVEASRRFPKWMDERLPAGDPLRKRYKDEIPFFDQFGFPKPVELIGHGPSRVLLPELYYRIYFLANESHDGKRLEQVATAMYDLTRIVLARRILVLTGRPVVRDVGALVPEFLPEAPLDPFSGGSFLFDGASGRFYSVGQDGRDDGLSSIYDTVSRSGGGDLVLPEPDIPSAGSVKGRL